MKRRLFNVLAGVSLVLCVATTVSWVRSLGHVGGFVWNGYSHFLSAGYIDGVLSLWVADDRRLAPYGLSSGGTKMQPGLNRAEIFTPSFNKRGFGCHLVRTVGPLPAGWWRFGGRRLLAVYLPYWLVTLLLAVWPGIWLCGFLESRWRIPPGLCLTCGYDLRATPDRCPECGIVPPKKQAISN